MASLSVQVLPGPLRRLSTTGRLLGDEHPCTIGQWIDAACAAGLMRVSEDRYRTLSLTPLGRDVMAGRVDELTLAVPVSGQARRRRRRSRRSARTRGGRW